MFEAQGVGRVGSEGNLNLGIPLSWLLAVAILGAPRCVDPSLPPSLSLSQGILSHAFLSSKQSWVFEFTALPSTTLLYYLDITLLHLHPISK